MEQLTPLDASFLYAETPRTPMHVAALSIYDPRAAPRGRVELGEIVENVRRRAGAIDCFHRRLVEVPFAADHPYWIPDGEFRPERHVHGTTLPDPGDWHALCRQVAALQGRRISRKRPLWEMHVIDGLDRVHGLPEGCYALLTKIHHAAVDGVAGLGVTLVLHDLEPDAADPSIEPWAGQAEPAGAHLLACALGRRFTDPLRWLGALSAWPGAAREMAPPPPAPRTRFDGAVSGERVFEASRFPVAGLRGIEAAVPGATLNDVVLAIVSGAMRRYLGEKRERPRDSLRAMAPISVRARDGEERGGNRLSQMVVSLYSDVADPLERLEALHQDTERAKAHALEPSVAAAARVSELVPAPWAAFATRFASASMATGYNTIVSNVPGPRVPLYHCGAKMIRVYGMGPLADGTGLFHTALSYAGEFTITTLSCPEMMPDPDFYHACLRSSYDSLHAARRSSGRARSSRGADHVRAALRD